ncbi:unnamed protein product [Rhizophagus irregularis]|nr:unnamed protein product [Rhizophagus irregularis]
MIVEGGIISFEISWSHDEVIGELEAGAISSSSDKICEGSDSSGAISSSSNEICEGSDSSGSSECSRNLR